MAKATKENAMNNETTNQAEEKRATMHISLSEKDKVFLKVYAAEHGTTVAAVIAECVEKLRKGKE